MSVEIKRISKYILHAFLQRSKAIIKKNLSLMVIEIIDLPIEPPKSYLSISWQAVGIVHL